MQNKIFKYRKKSQKNKPNLFRKYRIKTQNEAQQNCKTVKRNKTLFKITNQDREFFTIL